MLCPNCSFQLTGKENFCPQCAADLSLIADIPAPKKAQPQKEASIFTSEPPDVCRPEEPPKRKSHTAAIAMITVFVFTVLLVAGLGLGEYFGFLPVFSQGSLSPTKEESLLTTVKGEYTQDYGSVPPDITFNACRCTVTGKEGLSLRKGPSESYGQIDILPYGCLVQVTGGSSAHGEWVFVICDSAEKKGWVLSSCLTDTEALESSRKAPPEEETACSTDFRTYDAVVLAEKGLYLRKGPGTEYEIIDIVGNGVRVTVMAEDSNWLFVSLGGLQGYMKKEYLKALEEQDAEI